MPGCATIFVNRWRIYQTAIGAIHCYSSNPACSLANSVTVGSLLTQVSRLSSALYLPASSVGSSVRRFLPFCSSIPSSLFTDSFSSLDSFPAGFLCDFSNKFFIFPHRFPSSFTMVSLRMFSLVAAFLLPSLSCNHCLVTATSLLPLLSC